jgi:hypothetical protein
MQVISIFDARSAWGNSRSREAVLKCTTKNKKHKEVGTPDGGCFYIEGVGVDRGSLKIGDRSSVIAIYSRGESLSLGLGGRVRVGYPALPGN